MRLVRSKGNSKDCKNSRYKEQTLPPWLRFMPKQEHLQGWDPDLGEGTAVGQWMKSHRESHREVPVLLRWWNLLEIHPLELAGKSLFGTWWTSTMWNLPSEICPLRFWKKLTVEKDLTAGILPQNCPEGRVAGALQEPDTGKAGWAPADGHSSHVHCRSGLSGLSGYTETRKQYPFLLQCLSSTFYRQSLNHPSWQRKNILRT